MADTGWDLWRSSHPTPALLKQSHLQPRKLSRWFSDMSKDGDTTACLGNLCQFLVTIIVKKRFLVLRRNLLCFSLCHWLWSCHWKEPGSTPFTLFRCLYTSIGSTLSHLQSRLSSPSSQPFLIKKEIPQSLNPCLWKTWHPCLFKFPSGLHGTGWMTSLFARMKLQQSHSLQTSWTCSFLLKKIIAKAWWLLFLFIQMEIARVFFLSFYSFTSGMWTTLCLREIRSINLPKLSSYLIHFLCSS